MSTLTPRKQQGQVQYSTLPLFSELEKEEAQAPEPPPLSPGCKVVVSVSGGKDSIASLLLALEIYGRDRVIAHHQRIPEDWPGTLEYIQEVCKRFRIELFVSQAHYTGYRCANCQVHYLTSEEQPYHRACGSREGSYIMKVECLLDLVTWRGRWPSLDVRFCTSYLKRDVWNMWARRSRELLGPSPILVMGERWRESRGRAKLPYTRPRPKMEHVTEYRPILDYRRIDVFRKMRDYGIIPHYCYAAQGMTEDDMYERDQEGGPRLSCVICFLKPEEQLKASYQAAQGRPIVERGIATERAIGHRLTRDYSLEAAVSGQRSVYVDTVKGDNTMDLTFRPYRKTTKSRARPLTEEDYRQRGGLIQTIEGPARFAIGDYLGKDDKGEFPIRRVKVERDYRQITPPDAEGWADYMPFDVREAAQVSEPFELNGQCGKAGDYIVRGSDSQWIVDRELFEASYRPV